MRMRAAGSICVICFTASMPPISGMMMSIVTKSGFSCWYFSTACLPFSASPTTVNPACDRMSLTIVRMNTASSQTSTVLLTLPPLSDYLLNHRLDIENEHASAGNLDHANYRSCHGNVGLAGSHELVYRDILNVANIIDADTHHPLQAIDEQNQSFSAPESPLAQHNSAIDHGDDGAAKIDQTAHGVRRTRKSRHRLRRDYLAERIHVT